MKIHKTLFVIMCTIIIMSMTIGFDYLYTVRHEQAHTSIYEQYKIDSTTKINIFGTSTVTPNQEQLHKLPIMVQQQIEQSHSVVDAIGYPLEIVVILLSIIISILIITQIIKNEK